MLAKLRNLYEFSLLAAIAGGVGLTLLGAAGMMFPRAGIREVGAMVAVAGLLLTEAAIGLSVPLRTLSRAAHEAYGGQEFLHLKFWGRLKSFSILLNLLIVIGVGAILAAVSIRSGLVPAVIPLETTLRIVAILLAALALSIAYAHLLSLRVPLVRPTGRPTLAIVLIGASAITLAAALAFTLQLRPLTLLGLRMTSDDAAFFLLAGFCVAAGTLFSARALPSLLVIFWGDQRYYRGRTYLSQRKSILMPSVIAFTLLFLILMLLVVFGVGAGGLRQPARLGVIGFMAIALVVSVVASIRLARVKDEASLYRLKASAETKLGYTILGSSLGLAFLLLIVAVIIRQGLAPGGIGPHRWVDVLALACMAGLGPYGFWVAHRHRRIRKIEQRFPDLLRDVAASHRGGLTLSNSVTVAARGEYGMLTPEVVAMADQLSWSVPFEEALTRLNERVKTPLVERTTSLIIEASRSGGNTTDVLIAAANDAREIKNLEVDRSGTMSLYTIIIYVTFFVFLSVAAVLYGSFVPVLIESTEAARQIGSSGFGGISFDTPSLQEYRQFYLLASLVQGIGNGLVAGLMGSGRVSDGLRHSFLMVLFTVITFAFLI